MINRTQLTSSRLHVSTRKGQKLTNQNRWLVPLPKIVRFSRSVIDGTLHGESAVVLYPPRLMSIDTSKSLTDRLGLVEDVPNCI
ncbi:Fatty acid amide hydrolase [Trichinella pseudospiralis]